MANLVYRILLKFVLTAIGILLVGALPALFQGIRLDFSNYFSSIAGIFAGILNPEEMTYRILNNEYPLFPRIFEVWAYSMTLLFIAFFIALGIALILTFFTVKLPKKIKEKVKFVLFATESIPDILVVALFIFFVITIYQQTGILFFNVAVYDENIYVLPITALTILPTVLLFRAMVLEFEEEEGKQYVDVARSKGIKAQKLMVSHILRNTLISIFQNAKYILWFMLSNLLVIEYAFNLHGILDFMFMRYSPEVLTVGLFLIFSVIFFVLSVFQVIIEKVVMQEAEI
ncbi:ABC transporter permease subunit [Virgibacillus siamensis]|uniref:ABC transporter permease subunit n=1 Tax=Virgibacillus siamensis TaxID=480071 RepID=A0ABP3RAZ3_9BACI